MLKKNIIITILLLMPIITAVTMINPSISETTEKSVTMEEIAEYYAPIWYQDVYNTDADADYITNFDFDQNWIGYDNWEHQNDTDYHPLKPYIYYSVVETIDHWYIGYYDFHPRDWFLLPHENDMEGCLAIILKNGSTYGQAQAVITQAHTQFYQYIYPTDAGNKLTDDQADIDDTCHVTENGANGGYRAHIFVQSRGHGVHAAPHSSIFYSIDWWDDIGFPSGDGVIYNYNPNNISTAITDSTANYSLVDVSTIYDRVDNEEMYYHDDDNYYDDPFRGDTEGENKALPPWAWGADDGSEKGWIFWEPWKTANAFFDGETFSDELIRTNYDDRGTGAVSEFPLTPITIALTLITITTVLTLVLKKQKLGQF